MKSTPNLQLSLDDLLGDLRHARRLGDLSRLALVAYCDVRRWARVVGDEELARRSASMLTEQPLPNRDAFLLQVDQLIEELEQVRSRARTAWPGA